MNSINLTALNIGHRPNYSLISIGYLLGVVSGTVQADGYITTDNRPLQFGKLSENIRVFLKIGIFGFYSEKKH